MRKIADSIKSPPSSEKESSPSLTGPPPGAGYHWQHEPPPGDTLQWVTGAKAFAARVRGHLALLAEGIATRGHLDDLLIGPHLEAAIEDLGELEWRLLHLHSKACRAATKRQSSEDNA
jgi:hypothetical protein